VKLLVIHGPNLNLLGTREPEIYGTLSLDDIDGLIADYGEQRGVQVFTYQSNHEGDIIDALQAAVTEKCDAVVINPGALTHTSMAIMDAIRSISVPVVEVHLTNLFSRGAERAHSVTTGACRGIISGFGFESYLLGVDAALRIVGPKKAKKPRATAAKRTRRGASKKRS